MPTRIDNPTLSKSTDTTRVDAGDARSETSNKDFAELRGAAPGTPDETRADPAAVITAIVQDVARGLGDGQVGGTESAMRLVVQQVVEARARRTGVSVRPEAVRELQQALLADPGFVDRVQRMLDEAARPPE